MTILWLVHGLCVWPIWGQFLGSFEVALWSILWPILTAYEWTIRCVDMLDCVLIYVDKCVFRYIDMDGCKLYVVDIIIHDIENKIWYVNVSYSIHTVASHITYARGHHIK